MSNILVLTKSFKYSTSPQEPWIIGISPFLHIVLDYKFMDEKELDEFLKDGSIRFCENLNEFVDKRREVLGDEELYAGITFAFIVRYKPIELERHEYKETLTKFFFSIKDTDDDQT